MSPETGAGDQPLQDLKTEIRQRGLALGFTRVGFALAQRLNEGQRLRKWLANGFAGTMQWLEKRQEERLDPTVLAPWVNSLILVSIPYRSALPKTGPLEGRISRYAVAADYHDVLKSRLARLGRFIQDREPGSRVVPVVDTGAILEKAWAVRAGLGWQGKHTNLIDPVRGSWLFLGELLTNLSLPPDHAPITDQCGTCTACLDACPTQAFPEPYVLDSRKCISYLTIEHRGSLPEETRSGMEDWVFGCDICQEVCPWNRDPAPPDRELDEELRSGELGKLLTLTAEDFRERFKGTAIRRTGHGRMLRNAAVALGNSGRSEAVPELTTALEHADPLVREHAAWGLGRLGTPSAREALTRHLSREDCPQVREATQRALEKSPPPPPASQRSSRRD